MSRAGDEGVNETSFCFVIQRQILRTNSAANHRVNCPSRGVVSVNNRKKTDASANENCLLTERTQLKCPWSWSKYVNTTDSCPERLCLLSADTAPHFTCMAPLIRPGYPHRIALRVAEPAVAAARFLPPPSARRCTFAPHSRLAGSYRAGCR